MPNSFDALPGKPVRDVAVIVDAEQGSRHVLRRVLEAGNWRVFEADTWMRGAIQAGVRAADLVIVDAHLPDGDGIGLIRDLRAWSTVPVVLVAKALSPDLIARALEAGASQVLSKALGAEQLADCVLRYRRDAADQPVSADLFASADPPAPGAMPGMNRDITPVAGGEDTPEPGIRASVLEEKLGQANW
jgi:DNA-binding response OmpR family regulator